MPCCYGCRRFCGWTISREVSKLSLIIPRQKRIVHLNGRTRPRTYPSNRIKNTKYNLLTFIPIVLFNQFKFFFNLFFLMIALSQFVPVLKVGKIRNH